MPADSDKNMVIFSKGNEVIPMNVGLEFLHLDGELEYFWWNNYDEAKEHFEMFNESDSDIYRRIRLVDWMGNLLEEKYL